MHITSLRSILIRIIVECRSAGGELGGLRCGRGEAGAAHGRAADTAAGDGDHHGDHDLNRRQLNIGQWTYHI